MPSQKKTKNTASPVIGSKTAGRHMPILASTLNYEEIIIGQAKAIAASDEFLCRTCESPLSESEHEFGWCLCFTCHPLPSNPQHALPWDMVWRFFLAKQTEE